MVLSPKCLSFAIADPDIDFKIKILKALLDKVFYNVTIWSSVPEVGKHVPKSELGT